MDYEDIKELVTNLGAVVSEIKTGRAVATKRVGGYIALGPIPSWLPSAPRGACQLFSAPH